MSAACYPWQRGIEFLRLNFKRNNFVRPFNSRRLLRQRLPGEYIFSASELARRSKKNRGKLFNVVEWRTRHDTPTMNCLLVTLDRPGFNVEIIKSWSWMCRDRLCRRILPGGNVCNNTEVYSSNSYSYGVEQEEELVLFFTAYFSLSLSFFLSLSYFCY